MIDSVNNDGGGSHVCEFNPKKLKYDKGGVPILSISEIEAIAEELLHKYCPHVFNKPGITPVAQIIDRLHERTELLFAMADLGYKGTAKVLGKVSFHKKLLTLDFSLEDERKPAYRFTAAHEIGHWVLHRYNYKNWSFGNHSIAGSELEDGDDTLCRLEQRTHQDWLEFHANIFAASLVTPRKMFVVALIEAQQAIGIKRNLGHVFLSNAEYSQRDFEIVVSKISHIFDVSKESVRVRIRTLQLIEDESKPNHSSRLVKNLLPVD